MSFDGPPYDDVILQDPHPLLRQRAAEVTDFSGIPVVAARLMEACRKTGNGAGLAANQIGVLQRVILIDLNNSGFIMVNPVIKSRRGEQRVDDGCLSVAGGRRRGVTLRAAEVYVEYQEVDGTPRKKLVKGFRAAVVQHEIDHLDGVLFIDRVVQWKAA